MKRITTAFIILTLLCFGTGCAKQSSITSEPTEKVKDPEEKTTESTDIISTEKEEEILTCFVNGCDEMIGAQADDHVPIYCNSHYYSFLQNGLGDEIYEDSFVNSSSTDNDKEIFSKIMPFVGMHEKYVGKTILGDDYKFDVVTYDTTTDKTNRYIWYRPDGRKLIALCFDNSTHCIESMALYYDNMYYPYYIIGEYPAYEKYVRSKDAVYSENTREAKGENKSDPYNVYEYDDPDDFAEDMWEDFDDSYEDGYDEAYDYWEELH